MECLPLVDAVYCCYPHTDVCLRGQRCVCVCVFVCKLSATKQNFSWGDFYVFSMKCLEKIVLFLQCETAEVRGHKSGNLRSTQADEITFKSSIKDLLSPPIASCYA